MTQRKQKLELTWIGKENRPRLEPRILLEDAESSYHAPHRVSTNDLFDNRLIFGDNLRMIYWTAGESARGCCRLLGGAYTDFDHFSRNLAFLVRKDRPELRAAFDYGLDMAQKNGTTAKIFNAYVPLSPW